MLEIELLQQRLGKVPEFIDSELRPRVIAFSEDQPKLGGPIVAALKKWGFWIVLGYFMQFAAGLMHASRLKAIVGPLGLVLTYAAGGVLLWALKPYLFKAKERFERMRTLTALIKARAIGFLGFHYESSVEFPTALVHSCGLFTRYDRAYAEDRVFGKLGEAEFEMMELSTSKVERRGKAIKLIPLFKGLLVVVDFHKNFSGHTVVLSDHAEKSLGFVGRSMQRLAADVGLQSEMGLGRLKLIELEDPEFEGKFKVMSSDPVEARYILTPAYMQTLIQFRRQVGDRVQLSFMQGKMIMTLPYQSDFLWFPIQPDDALASVPRVLEEVVGVLRLVADLKVQSNLFQARGGSSKAG